LFPLSESAKRFRSAKVSHALLTDAARALSDISGVASYGALAHVPPSTSNNFILSSLWSISDSQLSKYCVIYEISWCRCQQLTALSISTALVTKLLVIKQLLQPALKSDAIASWPNFQLCPRLLATNPGDATERYNNYLHIHSLGGVLSVISSRSAIIWWRSVRLSLRSSRPEIEIILHKFQFDR